MLILGGKSAVGHILHVVTGPESDLHMDLNGSCVLDITQVLMGMNGADRVLLSLTRCKSEGSTVKTLAGASVPHISSFEEHKIVEERNPLDPKPGRARDGEILPALVVGRCNFCGVSDVELMRITGIKICGKCAQIELGRKREIKGKQGEEQ